MKICNGLAKHHISIFECNILNLDLTSRTVKMLAYFFIPSYHCYEKMSVF